jgi:hypothetical protein
MKKLIPGKSYYLEYSKRIPTRIHQSGFVVESEERDFYGNYEYIGKRKRKFHFYNGETGLDIYLSQADLEKYLNSPG